MSDAAQGRRPPPTTFIDQVPVEKINELVAANGDAQVLVRITRRLADGSLVTCHPSRPMQTSRVLDIEAFCQSCGGGARYEIYVKDPITKQLVLPTFSFKVDGQIKDWYDVEEMERTAPERAVEAAGRAALGKTGGTNGLPASVAHLPPERIPRHPQATGWIANLQPIDQWRMLGEPTLVEAGPHITSPLMAGPQGVSFHSGPFSGALPAPGAQLPPGASHFSDAIAQKHADELRAEKERLATENARLQEKLEAEKDKHARDMQQINDRFAAMEKKAASDLAEASIKSLERKFEMLVAAKPAPTIDYVGLAGAFAPVIIAMLTSGKDANAQSLALLTTAIAKPSSNGTMDMLKVLGPLLVPIVTKFIDSKSPEAQSKILETMFDAQQNNVALAAQVMQMMTQAQGGENNPWVALVGQLIAGGGEVLNAYLEEKKKSAREAQTPRLVHQGQQIPLPPMAQPPVQPPVRPVTTVATPTPSAPVEGAAGYGTLDETPPATPDAQAAHSPGAPPGNGAASTTPAEIEHVGVPVDAAEAAGAESADGNGDDDTPPTADEVVEMFVSHPQVTPQFKTTPWRDIVYRMHSGEPEDTPELVAPAIIKQLGKLEERGLLPDLLRSWRTAPTMTFNALVRFLPVYEYYPEYAGELVSALVERVGTPQDEDTSNAPPS